MRHKNRSTVRTGAAAVEFAIVAPLLFMIVFGIIEFGRMIMVQQILTNASREGARRAIIEDATHAEVELLVSNYLSNASVSGATVTVAPNDLSNLGFGDPVTVTVAVPFDDVSWAGSAWFLGGSMLQANTIMQGERLQ
jgi:Flp pilus assembly protein TadG